MNLNTTYDVENEIEKYEEELDLLLHDMYLINKHLHKEEIRQRFEDLADEYYEDDEYGVYKNNLTNEDIYDDLLDKYEQLHEFDYDYRIPALILMLRSLEDIREELEEIELSNIEGYAED